MAQIQQNDQASQKELKRLRGLRGNGVCADCGRQDTTWATVSHGVFICVTCSDVHRSVGTHVTKVKGCTGTYLWGPDELEKMQTMGNHIANEVYGSEKVDPNASKEQKQRYVIDKYEKRAFVGKVTSAPAKAKSATPKIEHAEARVRRVEPVEPTGNAAALSAPQLSDQGSSMKNGKAVTVRGTDIPASLFDELFNEVEDSYFGSSEGFSKSSAKDIGQPSDENCLDAFLNSALHVNTQPLSVAKSGYPSSLDSILISKKVDVADPFADWLAF